MSGIGWTKFEPISLRQEKKRRKRIEKAQKAAEKAAKHGRTKAERVLEATRNAKARRILDQHRLDEDE